MPATMIRLNLVDGLGPASRVGIGLAELLEGAAMIGVLREDAAQARDRLRGLAVAQIDVGLGEQLIGIAFGQGLGLRGSPALRRLRGRRGLWPSSRRRFGLERDLVVGLEGQLDVVVAAEGQSARAEVVVERQEGLVREQLVLGDLRILHLRDVDREPGARSHLRNREALQELARLVLVAAVAIQLRQPPRRVRELLLVTRAGIEVDQQLVLRGIRRGIQRTDREGLGAIVGTGGDELANERRE